MRIAISCFVGLSVFLLLAAPALAEPLEVAKVYRDYPGYINPALCDNPNLGKATSDADSAAQARPAAAACEPVPLAYRSDNPVGVPYLGAWAGLVATPDVDYDAPGENGDIKFDTGYGGGLAIGYDFGPARLEVEGSYRNSNAEEGDADLKIRTLMVNGYADFQTGSMTTPYLGAGIGYAKVDVEGDDDEVFAGQLAAGVLFAVSPAVAVDLGYRFLMTDDPKIGGADLEVRQHTASLGVQVRF
jgi:opacity protein-like surface antigen